MNVTCSVLTGAHVRLEPLRREHIAPLVEAAGRDLLRNKDLARLNCDLELELDPEASVMGEWDHDAVRRLFNSLEFRTLLERLEDVERAAKPKVEAASLDVRTGTPADLAVSLEERAPRAVHPQIPEGKARR